MSDYIAFWVARFVAEAIIAAGFIAAVLAVLIYLSRPKRSK
jgi:hypothetical protein